MGNYLIPVLIFVTLSLFYPTDAHAYIDPGSSSLIVQLLIGMAAGAVFTAKLWKKKLTDRLVNRPTASNKKSPPTKKAS